MYIINEENHSCIAACKDPYKAIDWLLDNDWISPSSCGITPDEQEFQLWELTGASKEECEAKPYIIRNYFKRMNFKKFKKIFEMFGIYFEEIDVIDY